MNTFDIVKKHIDKNDFLGLLTSGVPSDEHDIKLINI